MHSARLTQYSNGGGCACKLPQSMLSGILAAARAHGASIPDANLLVGLERPDDAAVYRVAHDRAIVANASAASVAREFGVRGGTDVTGFGLLGHVHEMAMASGLSAEVWTRALPVLPGVRDLLEAGFAPDGSRRNLRDALAEGWFQPADADEYEQLLLADSQTSGGLLLALAPDRMPGLLRRIQALGDQVACVVGRLACGSVGHVHARGAEPSPT